MAICINNPYTQANKSRCNNISFGAKRLSPETAGALKRKLFTAKSWDIHCHRASDHDTYNAALALSHLADENGIETHICVDGKNLEALTLNPERQRTKESSQPADLALILDYNATDRISGNSSELLERTPTKVIIDHHPQTAKTIPNALSYIDTTGRSCCGVIYRWLEALGKTIDSATARLLALGVKSDYEKSKLVRFKNSHLERLGALADDSNSTEILDSIEARLSTSDRDEIGRHLDVMSNLTPAEIALQQRLFSTVRTTLNGKLAYVIIEPGDEQWQAVGLKTPRTAKILRDLRLRLTSGNIANDNMFTPVQQRAFSSITGAAIFYPVDNCAYRFSIHSKGDYANRWLNYAREVFQRGSDRELIGGGHPNRMGGRISSWDKEETWRLIGSFIEAAQKVN